RCVGLRHCWASLHTPAVNNGGHQQFLDPTSRRHRGQAVNSVTGDDKSEVRRQESEVRRMLKLENRNSKLENRNWKIEIRNSLRAKSPPPRKRGSVRRWIPACAGMTH